MNFRVFSGVNLRTGDATATAGTMPLPPGPPLPLGLPAPVLITLGGLGLGLGTVLFGSFSGVTRTGLGSLEPIALTASTAAAFLALLLRVRARVTGEEAVRWVSRGVAAAVVFMLIEHATGATVVPDVLDPRQAGPYLAWHLLVPAGAVLGLVTWSTPWRWGAFVAVIGLAALLTVPTLVHTGPATPSTGTGRGAALGAGLVVVWGVTAAWWLWRAGRRPRWSEAWVGVTLVLGITELSAALLADGPGQRWAVAALRWQAFVFPVAGTVAGVIRVHRALVDRTAELIRETQAHQEANELLARRNADLDAYANVLAHDLRAPLQVAIWSLEVALEDLGPDLDPRIRTLLERASSSQYVATDLVGSLLTLARARDQDLELQALDVQTLVDEVVAHTPDVHATQVTVRAPCSVVADRTALRQILQNLIGNAVAYRRPDTDPRIEVRVKPMADGGWQVTVADDGVGVAPEDRTRIFNAFVRVETTSRQAGVGLGLVICQRLVERHGGEIGVGHSDLGGTEFWFTLPARQPRSVDLRDADVPLTTAADRQ